MIVRWRTDALEKDYAEVHNKTAVIAFSIVLQSAAAITSFLGLMTIRHFGTRKSQGSHRPEKH